MRSKALLLVFVTLLSACTEPGETTGVAAATGGAIGTGLGAIIGSQTEVMLEEALLSVQRQEGGLVRLYWRDLLCT